MAEQTKKPGADGQPASGPSNINYGSGSASALPPRGVVRSSLMTVGQKVSDILKYCEDVLSSGKGMSQALEQQMLQDFPALVAALFGMPSYQEAAYGSSKGWMQQLAKTEDYHGMWRLLEAKGAFITLLCNVRRATNVPSYVFPISLLPGPTRALLSRDRARSFSTSLRMQETIPSVYANRINPQGQEGIKVDALEYLMWGFLWFATHKQGAGDVSLFATAERDTAVHHTMTNTLFMSTFRQWSLLFLGMDAEAEALGPRRSQSSSGIFTFFCQSVAEFWMNQNSFAFFHQVGEQGSDSVRAGEYVPPTYLSLNGVYDLTALCIYSTTEALAFSGDSGNVQRYDTRGHAYGEAFSARNPITAAADRITGQCLKLHLLDQLYAHLKLSLELKPDYFPYISKLWALVLSPFEDRADLEAHETRMKKKAEKERKKKQEDQFTLEEVQPIMAVLNPWVPRSLKSPFYKKGLKKGASKPVKHSARQAGAKKVVSFFSPPPKSKSSSSSSGGRADNMDWYDFYEVEGRPRASWSKVTSSWWGSSHEDKHRAEEKRMLQAEYRGYIVHNFPLYLPLFRHFLARLHYMHVQRNHPFSEVAVRAFQIIVNAFYDHAVYDMVSELDKALHSETAATNRDAVHIMKRWMLLERTKYSEKEPTWTDPRLQALVTDLIICLNKFMRFNVGSRKPSSFWGGSSGGSGSLDVKAMVGRVTHCLSWMFKLQTERVEALLEEDKKRDEARDHEINQQRKRMEIGHSMRQLTDEQRQQLAQGLLKLDALDISYTGQPWERPIDSSECGPLLWLLYNVSVLFGLVEKNSGRTFVNLRPAGKWFFIYAVAGLILVALFVRYVDIEFSISLDI